MKCLFLVGLLLCAGGLQAKTFQFLYIEASEGNASGGHVALKLGTEVYHYQYDKALIRLFKNRAEAFLADYQFKQNRTIHVAEIGVADKVYDLISNHFKARYFEQKQYLKRLRSIQADYTLLQSLLATQIGDLKPSNENDENHSVTLKGAGLFYSDKDGENTSGADCDVAATGANALAEIRQRLDKRYGNGFLKQKISRLRQEIGSLVPTEKADIASPSYSFSEQYADMLNGLLALRVIDTNKALTKNACFQLADPRINLTGQSIDKAKAYRQDLMRATEMLVNSSRPDWGYALFVTLARLVVIEHSIQTHIWTFLDDTDNKADVIPVDQFQLYPRQLENIKLDDFRRLQKWATKFAKASEPYELSYVKLEMAANRYGQWFNSNKVSGIRFRNEQPLPIKSVGASRFLVRVLSPEQLRVALHHKENQILRLREKDADDNGYNLINRNCVTALFETIDSALAGQSGKLMGGFVDPKETLVPYQAFAVVQSSYHVVKLSTLPGYRQQKLVSLYQREMDSLVYARESNIFSSSLYRYNPEDAWFVFFTDDTVLLRPLFGAVNTVAATGQSLFGLFAWPFDEGKAIKTGARGILTSLPELAFFNIRKGSYPMAFK